jgi:Domain of unknown function (DUF4349)
MSQRDLGAELRATRITAPPEVRERIRLIAASDTSVRAPRFTWRRALVVALPVAAAVAATVVVTRPSHHATAVPLVPTVIRSAVAHGSAAAKAPPTVFAKPAESGAKAIPVTPSRTRVQRYGASLTLRVPTPNGVSNGVKHALRIAALLGGHPTSVHASSQGHTAHADLVLKIPRANVQRAITQLSQLGTITGERVDVQDLQAGLDTTARTIARLQKQLSGLLAQPQTDATARQIAALTARVVQLQRAQATTIRTAHFATVNLHLGTPVVKAVTPHKHHGPFAWLLRALVWLGIGAVYALVLGIPVALLGVLVALIARAVRRRREDALLSRT